jgi:hypothetical protein
MKQKLLLTLFIATINLAVNAQKQKSSVYAITGSQKGQNNWTEVRLLDITSGEELKTVFKNSEETQPLNARTGKPVVKKDLTPENLQYARMSPDGNVIISTDNNGRTVIRMRPERNTATSRAPEDASRVKEELLQKLIIDRQSSVSAPALQASKIKEEAMQKLLAENKTVLTANAVRVTTSKEGEVTTLIIERNGEVIKVTPRTSINTNVNSNVNTNVNTNINTNVITHVRTNVNTNTLVATTSNIEVRKVVGCTMPIPVRTEVIMRMSPSLDKPFATYSAACAYDKKHERLYYTPMGIAQLRYIDLKAKTPQVYYFEDEQFGALRNRGDVSNQITRMVIGADGNGYALTNNAEHLVRFTTDKKATITDLGGLTDAAENGNYSVHNAGGYGGDIIAAKTGDLYLITANHNIFQIDTKGMVATYKGTIQGLPKGYSTNGAAVEEGSMVLVNSSNSTQGLYHFDMNTLTAEKISTSSEVFNASDLATATLLTVKNDKPKEQAQQLAPPVVTQQTVEIAPKNTQIEEAAPETRLGVYPNPVTNNLVNLILENYTPGKYQAKLIDVTGKQLGNKNFTIASKLHTEPFNLPQSIAKGNYLIQIYDQTTRNSGVVKLVVQ